MEDIMIKFKSSKKKGLNSRTLSNISRELRADKAEIVYVQDISPDFKKMLNDYLERNSRTVVNSLEEDQLSPNTLMLLIKEEGKRKKPRSIVLGKLNGLISKTGGQ